MRRKIIKYDHVYELRRGDVIKIDGLPLEYLGNSSFGTNTEMHFDSINMNDKP